MLKSLKARLGKSRDLQKDEQESRAWVYNHRMSLFSALPTKASIIMIGDSLVENGEWSELLSGYDVLNRGISGETAEGLARRLDEVLMRKPKFVIGMIGVNDIPKFDDVRELASLIIGIMDRVIESGAALLWLPIFPVAHPRSISNEAIIECNFLLQEAAAARCMSFLTIAELQDADGNLSKDVSEDGLHLNGEGYLRWARELRKWLNSRYS